MTVQIIRKSIPAGNWASGEYARGVRHRKVGAILHIIVGTLPGCTAHFQNPETGYATSLAVGTADGRADGPLEVHRYVPADGRCYGSANRWADGKGEAIEMQGVYTVERRVMDHVAALLVDLMLAEDWPPIDGKRQFVLGDFPDHRYADRDIPGFGVDFNLITHRSMAFKNCPNDTDVHYITRKANELLADRNPTTPTAPTSEPDEEDDDMRVKFGHRSTGNDEWMIVHPELVGAAGQQGYDVTTDLERAEAWSRLYRNGWAPSLTGPAGRYDFDLPRDEYVAIQAAAADTRAAFVRGRASA